jgi:hypothetical protein
MNVPRCLTISLSENVPNTLRAALSVFGTFSDRLTLMNVPRCLTIKGDSCRAGRSATRGMAAIRDQGQWSMHLWSSRKLIWRTRRSSGWEQTSSLWSFFPVYNNIHALTSHALPYIMVLSVAMYKFHAVAGLFFTTSALFSVSPLNVLFWL